MKRKIGLIAVTLIVLGLGGWWLFKDKLSDSSNQATTPGTATVTIGTLEDTVTAQGKLEPREYVDVGVQVSGQLEKLHIDIGDVVKTGDLIAEIDPQVYEARVQADEANLKRLQAQMAQQDAQLKQAKLKFDRNQKLVKAKAVSQELFEATDAEYKVAEAQLAALSAQIEEAQSTLDGDKANLSYTKIYAPMDGTVVAQTTREGQTVNASQSAPTIVQLANLDIMTVRSQVAEADVMRLKPEMDVYFTTLGSQDRKWKGKVRQILPTPETINDVVLYNVLIDVDNTDRQLMTGMSTQVFFIIARAENVTLLPVSALGKRMAKDDSDLGQAYIVKVQNGKVTEDRIVHVGLMDRTMAEIKDGLKDGDIVTLTTVAPPRPQNSGGPSGGGMRGGGMPRL